MANGSEVCCVCGFSIQTGCTLNRIIRDLYSDFSIKEVDAQRAINCKGSKRAGHKELLISNR